MIYDTIIIGGGPAGLSAGIYAARFKLKTLIITKRIGGLLNEVHTIENWPGEISISGSDLTNKIKKHLETYKVPIVEDEVIDIVKGKNFTAKTKTKNYEAKTIIFAAGTERRRLDIPGEKEFRGKGVSYCTICDAPFFKNKAVGVVGGSDAAAKEALLLSKYAKKVYIIYRKAEIRAEPLTRELVEKNKKIEIIPNTNIVEIKGDKLLKSVVFDSGREFNLDGLFIEIGGVPPSELAEKLGVKINERKEIITNKNSETNVPGVYAAGDVTDRVFKQIITGAAEGVLAVFSAYGFLRSK